MGWLPVIQPKPVAQTLSQDTVHQTQKWPRKRLAQLLFPLRKELHQKRLVEVPPRPELGAERDEKEAASETQECKIQAAHIFSDGLLNLDLKEAAERLSNARHS